MPICVFQIENLRTYRLIISAQKCTMGVHTKKDVKMVCTNLAQAVKFMPTQDIRMLWLALRLAKMFFLSCKLGCEWIQPKNHMRVNYGSALPGW